MADDRQYYRSLAQQYAASPDELSRQVTSYANQQGHTPDYIKSLFPNDPNITTGFLNAYVGSQGDAFNYGGSSPSATAGPQAVNYNAGTFQSPSNPIDYNALKNNPYAPEMGADALSPRQPDFTNFYANLPQTTQAPTAAADPFPGGNYSGQANNVNVGAGQGLYPRPPSDARGAYTQYPTPIPQTPNFWVGANLQGEANKDAAYDTSRLQSPDQYNPFGQQSVTYGPDGNPIVTQDFSDPLQNRFNTLNKILSDSYSATAPGSLFGNLRAPFDESMLAERTVSPTAGGVGDVSEALWQREQPRLERRRQQAENDLLVRGFNPGTEGYDDYMDEVSRAENDFRLGLMGVAGQEQSRLFGLESSLRGQQLGEQQTFRGQPINEYDALVRALQPQLPQFQGYQGANIDPAPLFNSMGAEGQFNLGRYATSVDGELGTRNVDASKNAANRGLFLDAMQWLI